MSRAPPTNTDVNTFISTVASGWRTFAILQPFVEMSNFPSTTTRKRLAGRLPVIWTPSSGGNTTKHITQRSTSPTSQEQIRNPVECTFRCCPALILLMPPGFATLRQTTRTTHHQLSKTTHSITDIRPVTYVQRMRFAKHGRHLSVAHHQDNPTASDKKHTQCEICEHASRGGGSAIQKMVPLDHNVHNTCSDNTCICLTSLEHCRVQRNTHTPRHITRVKLCVQFCWWRSSTNVFQ